MKWNMLLSFYVILQWYDVTIVWYFIWSWLSLVCTRLIQVLSACWIHGLAFGANWYQKSVWCTLMSNAHMDVILWSVCYFGAYCTSYYWPALRAGLLWCNFFGQPGSVSKFPPLLWVKLWVGWVGRGYTEISRYFPASWINWVTLVTKIKLLYSLRF